MSNESRSGNCLTQDLLIGLLQDSLPKNEQLRAAEHVQTCTICQKELETICEQGKLELPGSTSFQNEPGRGSVAEWSGKLAERLLAELQQDGPSVPTSQPADPPSMATIISTEEESPATEQTAKRGAVDSETSVTQQHSSRSDSPTELHIAEMFGRYKVEKILGQGAMGAVYLARDTQLDRDVALKIPKFGSGNNVDDQELLERFYREARAAATLRSPYICPVYDVGEINGQHYITMAYIEGRPLKDFTKSKKKHSEKQIATTLRKLAQGLYQAHTIGVVHRDLKPANVMVDMKGEPVVMDFGLARRSSSDDVQVTQSGAIMGTPAYMSPEQVEGDQEKIGPQADIYALGIIMYELITGDMPYKGSLMSILQQIALNNPEKPSKLRPDLDPRMEQICLKMMAGDLSKRYQTMEEVAADLQDVLRTPRKKTKQVAPQREPKPTSIPTATEESNPALLSIKPQSITEQLREKRSGAASKSKRKSSSHTSSSGFNKNLLIAGGVIGLLLLMMGIVFLVRVGKYDVQITLDDPSITLSVDGETLNINNGSELIKLSAGEHKLQLEKDGLKTHVEEFTVTKDGKTALTATVVNGKLGALLNKEQPGSHSESEPFKSPPASASTPPKKALSASQQLTGSRTGLQFDGTSDEPFVASLEGEAPIKELTLEAWITGQSKMDGTVIVEMQGPNISHTSISYSLFNGWQAYCYHKGVNVGERAPYYPQERTHVATVYSPGKLSLFVNGKLTASEPFSGDPKSYEMLLIGANPHNRNQFTGIVDEVRVSRGARYLTDFDPAERFETDDKTVALYHFDEGSGDIAKDSSGNGHHGKLVGAKWVKVDGAKSVTSTPSQRQSVMGSDESPPLRWPLEPSKPEDITWLLETLDANVTLRLGPEDEVELKRYHPLPSERATIVGVEFHGVGVKRRFSDAFLNRLATNVDLESLRFNCAADGQQASITEEGFRHLSVLEQLRELQFTNFFVSPKFPVDLSIFERNKRLKTLRLGGGNGIARPYPNIDRLTSVEEIFLYRYLHEDVDALARMPRLSHLTMWNRANLRPQLVEYARLCEKRMPWCRITVSPSEPNEETLVIEPTAARPGSLSTAPPPAIAPFDEAQAKAYQQAWAKYLGVPVEYTNSIGMKFRLIPPGEFLMGSTPEEIAAALKVAGEDEAWRERINSEGPQHKVVLTRPVYVGVTEVTQSQYEQVLGMNPSHFSATGEDKDAVANMETGNHPVENVSWNDAAEFCAKLSQQEKLKPFYFRSGETVTPLDGTGYRLPTEAEWESACRAGTTMRFWSGDEDQDLIQAGWFGGNSGRRMHAAGKLKANPFGLADMHGNVWEWVQDSWDPAFYGKFKKNAAIDPSSPFSAGSQRVLRSGNWRDYPSGCRSSSRYAGYPSRRFNYFGFRVVLLANAVKESLQPKDVSSTGKVTKGWSDDAPSAAIAPFDAEQAKAHQQAWAKHLGEPVVTTNSIGMQLAVIPPGSFKMGHVDKPVDVTLTKPYRIGAHEVTQGQWKLVMETEPWMDQENVTTGQRVAATFMSWTDATEFCRKLTVSEQSAGKLPKGWEYRLPTEAEWEWACRAGTTTSYSFGDDASKLGEYAWFEENSKKAGEAYAHEVGLKKPNPWGLFDVHGNVWEWAQDQHDYKYELVGGTDPKGAGQGSHRVFRGGGWFGAAGVSRTWTRLRQLPSYVLGDVGFRVVLGPTRNAPGATAGSTSSENAFSPVNTVSDREIAEWVLSRGGEVTTNVSTDSTELPDSQFKVTEVIFNKQTQPPNPHEMARLQSLTELRSLHFYKVGFSDAQLAALAGFTNLQFLELNTPSITYEGMAVLKNLTKLESLSLEKARIGDEGLAHIQSLTNLRQLNLGFTQVTNEGLIYLCFVEKLSGELFEDALKGFHE